MNGLTAASLALIGGMTFGAALIRGLTGFGMAIILVPLLGLVMRPDEAVVLAILLQLLIGPVGLRTIMRDSDRASTGLIAGTAMAATPVGVWALMHTPPDYARVIIAAIAMAAFFIVVRAFRATRKPAFAVTVATGLAAGVLTGFAAMPGPPVVPYFLREAFDIRCARASMMLVFFATAIAGTLSSWLLGLVNGELAWLAILLFPPMVAGNWIGGLAFGKVSPMVWRSIVALLLGGAGVSALLRL